MAILKDGSDLKAVAETMDDGSLLIPEVGAVDGVRCIPRDPKVTVTIHDDGDRP